MTKKSTVRIAVAAIALLVIGLAGVSILRSQMPLPSDNTGTAAAARSLDTLEYDLIFRPTENQLAATLVWNFTNRENTALDGVVMRLPANAFGSADTSPAASEELYDLCYPDGFSPGGAIVHDVLWRGEAVPYDLDEKDATVLRVHTGPLEPGATGQLYMRSVLTIPRARYRFGSTDDLWMLGNALPFPAGTAAAAWQTLPFFSAGDPNTYAPYNIKVTLKLPGDIDCAAPFLWQQEESVNGKQLTGEGLAMRDIALVLGRGMITKQKAVGTTTLVSFADTEDSAGKALKFAEKTLTFFEKTYGEYPRPVYTVAMSDLPFDGMEYSGLAMLGKSQYSHDDSLELAVAHETAHQWFGILVNSDHFNDAWQDEAVCEFAALQYVKAVHGPAAFEQLKFLRADSPMRENIREDITPGSPLDRFHSMQEYSTVVYGRGLAMLLALNESIDMNAFLKSYCETYVFGHAAREDFENLLKKYAGWDVVPLLIDYLDTAI